MIAQILDKYHQLVFSVRRDSFYKDLADSIKRRVSLKLFAERLTANGRILKDTTLIHIGEKLRQRIEDDDEVGLLSSLSSIVPESDYALLKAAEQSRDVSASVEHLASVVAFKNRMRIQALASCILVSVIALMGAIVCWLTADITKSILDTAPELKFSGFNLLVVEFSDFIVKHWLGIVLVLIGSIGFIIYSAPSLTGKLRDKLDEMPVLRLYRDWHSANDMAALAMFLSSGFVLKEAINELSDGRNRWREWQVLKLNNSLDDFPNETLRAFSQGMFSRNIRARLAALTDSTNSLEDAIINLGAKELEKIEKDIKRAIFVATTSTIYGIFLLAVALVIGQSTIVNQLFNLPTGN